MPIPLVEAEPASNHLLSVWPSLSPAPVELAEAEMAVCNEGAHHNPSPGHTLSLSCPLSLNCSYSAVSAIGLITNIAGSAHYEELRLKGK